MYVCMYIHNTSLEKQNCLISIRILCIVLCNQFNFYVLPKYIHKITNITIINNNNSS